MPSWNMRLRALNKLQEIEIQSEYDELAIEKAQIEELLGSDNLQWTAIAEEMKTIKKAYGKDTDIGRRRTGFADEPDIEIDLATAFISKEPITVFLFRKGLDTGDERQGR